MVCPKCGARAYSVADKRDDYDANVTVRRRWCGNAECGARWNTTERIDKGQEVGFMKRTQSIVRRTSPSVVLRRAQQTVEDEHSRPGKLAQQTGFSRSLSDPDPISSPISLLPDPDLLSQRDQGVDPARVRREKAGKITYPDAFSAFWDAIRSNRHKGLKGDALEAWNKQGKPPADVLIAKWGEYIASLGDTYAKDVCRWLAKRGWEETYELTQPVVRRPTAIDRKTDEHRQMFEEGRAWAARSTK